MTLVFDLARFVSTGEEEYEFELVNSNPLLRTLDIGQNVVVRSCSPEDDKTVPDVCGSPVDFEVFAVDVLATWVASGSDFWGLRLVDDKITAVEQWWHP